MNNLTDLKTPSFKKGKPAFLKRRKVAEAIKVENPGISDDSKFAIATDVVKKVFKKKKA